MRILILDNRPSLGDNFLLGDLEVPDDWVPDDSTAGDHVTVIGGTSWEKFDGQWTNDPPSFIYVNDQKVKDPPSGGSFG